MSKSLPSPALVVRANGGQAFFEAKFRLGGRQIKRRIGPAWLDRDPVSGRWVGRRGRVAEGFYDDRRAHAAAAEIVRRELAEDARRDEAARDRRARAVNFGELAHAYLRWLEDVKGAKPSTLRDHRSMLAEPAVPKKRGNGVTTGHIMARLGDRPAAKITTREIEDLLATVSTSGVSARTVNKHRALVSAIFNYGARESTFNLPANPAHAVDKRREPHRAPLAFSTASRRSRSSHARLSTACIGHRG
jgi:hypothetical protein